MMSEPLYRAAPVFEEVGCVQELGELIAPLPRESLVRDGGYAPSADNGVRARWAARALVAFAEHLADGTLTGEEPETALVDLLADLLHLADALGQEPADLLELAVAHYGEEVAG